MTSASVDKDNKTLTVTLVIPAFNEERNLLHVLPMIPQLVDEVIIVDGHSIDNTVVEARKLCPWARIIYQEGKGKGNALRTGFGQATGDIVVTMDADGSMNPNEIVRFVEALRNGYDFARVPGLFEAVEPMMRQDTGYLATGRWRSLQICSIGHTIQT